MSLAVEVGKRAAAVVGIVAVVVVGAFAAGVLLGPNPSVGPAPAHPAWNDSRLDPEMLPSEGVANPSGNVGTVVFDRSHSNRFVREDVVALTRAITRAGGTVRYSDFGESVSSALQGADVFVVVDPGTGYTSEEVAAINSFVGNGGRVVIFGEPNRKVVSTTGLAAQVTVQRSHLTRLASAFGISFGTEYLYDMQHNDGGFKNVLVGSEGGSLTAGVDRAALYTAASVSVTRGDVLLRTSPAAAMEGHGRTVGYPVAVVTRDRGVLAIGDKTFMGSDTAAVGDNDVLLARIVEFMAGAG